MGLCSESGTGSPRVTSLGFAHLFDPEHPHHSRAHPHDDDDDDDSDDESEDAEDDDDGL